MQKIKDFCKRHRLLWLTLLVALAAAAVAAWAGFDLGQRVDNQPVYEIVNEIIPVPLQFLPRRTLQRRMTAQPGCTCPFRSKAGSAFTGFDWT